MLGLVRPYVDSDVRYIKVGRVYITYTIMSLQLMVFCYLLGSSWIVASVVLAVPVYLLSLLYFADFTVTKNGVDTKCIYLVHYGGYNTIRRFMFAFLLKSFVYESGINIDSFPLLLWNEKKKSYTCTCCLNVTSFDYNKRNSLKSWCCPLSSQKKNNMKKVLILF